MKFFYPANAALILLLALSHHLGAQEPVADWTFVPDYTLPGRARNYPGPRIPHPEGTPPLVSIESSPMLLRGEQPTQRLNNLLSAESIPTEAFTIEAWILHHVNQPVGGLIGVKGQRPGDPVLWSLGFYNWNSSFTMQGKDGALLQLQSRLPKWGGYKERWIHLVAAYNGDDVKVFVNGDEVARGQMHFEELAATDSVEFEMAAFMNNEPFMQWSNLFHRVRLYKEALPAARIRECYRELQVPVEEGRLFDGLFHFTAGPYLNYVTTDSINIVWETDRNSVSKLKWSSAGGGEGVIELPETSRSQEATISGLEANTAYFYEVSATDPDTGTTIHSGQLTFKTAADPGQPFSFAVIGDTESRPHVNDRISKLVWGERPDFLINLGDLTDGGRELHRYEWTHEYFVGMSQLASRVPVFAVPGNGEGDLYWYNHYHNYPEPGSFYQFRYGDAAFFMLDSNQRETGFREGGEQYEWLKTQLEQCDAEWKFVCHHHATYTGEEDDYGDSWAGEPTTFGDPAVQQIVPLYEQSGVDMVMFGHLHLYERTLPMRNGEIDFESGTIHLLAGGGGGNLEDFAPTPAFFSAKTHRGHHYVIVSMQGNTMSLRMYDTNGAIRDSLSITKDQSGLLRPARLSDPLETGSPGN